MDLITKSVSEESKIDVKTKGYQLESL